MKNLGYVGIIMAVVGIIMFVAVAIPVTVSLVSTGSGMNLTWLAANSPTTVTILNLLPLMVTIGALVFVVYSVVTGQ